MNRFSTERAAKEFLASEITSEAARQGLPLTDTEQKMLYFSETGWTLPDTPDVANAFDRQYDARKYERKIAALARAARRHAEENGKESWSDAVKRLTAGDHYLLVMIGQVSNRKPKSMTWRTTVAVILFILGMSVIPFVLEKILGHSPSKDDVTFFSWVTLVGLAGACAVINVAVGRRRFDGWVGRTLDWFVRARRP